MFKTNLILGAAAAAAGAGTATAAGTAGRYEVNLSQ
jgi:hypothetical protein